MNAIIKTYIVLKYALILCMEFLMNMGYLHIPLPSPLGKEVGGPSNIYRGAWPTPLLNDNNYLII